MYKRIIDTRITTRLPVLVFLAMFGSISIMGYANYSGFKNSVEDSIESFSQVVSLNAERDISKWFDEMSDQVDGLSKDPSVRDALNRFSFSLGVLGTSNLDELRQTYIDENPFPLGERHLFAEGRGTTSYDHIHKELHPYFRDIVERTGYYDLFLISPDGSIVYSVYKEDDFGTRLEGGIYSDTGLAESFRLASLSDGLSTSFVDFFPYAPSGNVPASFMAKSIIGDNGELIGVIAVQLPIDAISEILRSSSNLSEADEIYLVGPDSRARSASLQDNIIGIWDKLPNLPQISAIAERDISHFGNVEGISGKPVSSITRNFEIFENTWGLVVEVDRANSQFPVSQFAKKQFLFVTTGIALSLMFGFLIARSISRPLKEFSDVMKEISYENYEAEVPGVNRGDEIGDISRILDIFKGKLSLSMEAGIVEQRSKEEQTKVVSVLGDGLKSLANGDLTVKIPGPFSAEYEGLRTDFNSTIETMNNLMCSIVENSHEIRARAEEISTSSDDLSQRTENQAATLEETAAALDELTASVRSAAESASEVERVVSDARQDAEHSGEVVTEAVEAMSLIKKSSTEISQIIGVIDDIAFQTNLLSLNAGVEAARAGDAGRGFAVVASEVRALAQRSSEAAKQIKALINSSTEQVEAGVGLVGRTGDALGSIIERVGEIDNLVAGIAIGSREQSAGLGEINVGMSHLDQVTQQNAAMVGEATSAATTLKNESSSLGQVVARFRLQEGAGLQSALPDHDEEVVRFRSALNTSIEEFEPTLQTQETSFDAAANGPRWQDF